MKVQLHFIQISINNQFCYQNYYHINKNNIYHMYIYICTIIYFTQLIYRMGGMRRSSIIFFFYFIILIFFLSGSVSNFFVYLTIHIYIYIILYLYIQLCFGFFFSTKKEIFFLKYIYKFYSGYRYKYNMSTIMLNILHNLTFKTKILKEKDQIIAFLKLI